MVDPSINRLPTKAERIGAAAGSLLLAVISLFVLVGIGSAVLRDGSISTAVAVWATFASLASLLFLRTAYRALFLASTLPSKRSLVLMSAAMMILGASAPIAWLFTASIPPGAFAASLGCFFMGLFNLKEAIRGPRHGG